MAPRTHFIVTFVVMAICVAHVSSQQNQKCPDPCSIVRCPERCLAVKVFCYDPNRPCCPVAQCVPAINATVTKPGSCPNMRPGQVDACAVFCHVDNDCPREQKCCSNSCGHSCQNPIKATPPKPGSCPKVRPGQVGACVDLCNDDKDCPGEHKCCSNGCGHSCEKPSTESEIFCGDPCFSSPCAPGETCSNYFVQCNKEPCCPIARCTRKGEVVRDKPGLCPGLWPGQAGPCVHGCGSDNHCPTNLKCCSTGCGQICHNPWWRAD